eukprot:g8418.t1
MELEREGPTYTVDTLRTLNNRAEAPDQELFFLIGGDSLAEFVTWREPGQIVELATIVAVNRGGEPMPDVAAVGKQLGESVADRIQIVEIPGIDISSTDLRERVRTGRTIRYMTPRAVELFIEQQTLYREAQIIRTNEGGPMCRRRKGLCLLSGFAVLIASASVGTADVIKLKNGGVIRGKIDRGVTITTADPLVITTLSGTVVAVKRANIDSAVRRSMTVEEYQTRVRRSPNTIQGHLELAEWCRGKGMIDERELHMRKVLKLDPEHLDARRALGYSKRGGKWSTAEERKRARGLVRYKGRFITPEELAIRKKAEEQSDRERDWAIKVKTWRAWMSHRIAEKRVEGTQKLKGITDPDAVTGLARYLSKDQNPQVRSMYIDILGNIPGSQSATALVKQMLNDISDDLRYKALNAIRDEQFAAAMAMFIEALKSPSNMIVNRAALGLRRVGNENAIVPLVNALVTTHKYKVRVPDRSGMIGFNTNGSFSGGQPILPPHIEAMLRTGQLPFGVEINLPKNANKPVRTKVSAVIGGNGPNGKSAVKRKNEVNAKNGARVRKSVNVANVNVVNVNEANVNEANANEANANGVNANGVNVANVNEETVNDVNVKNVAKNGVKAIGLKTANAGGKLNVVNEAPAEIDRVKSNGAALVEKSGNC